MDHPDFIYCCESYMMHAEDDMLGEASEERKKKASGPHDVGEEPL